MELVNLNLDITVIIINMNSKDNPIPVRVLKEKLNIIDKHINIPRGTKKKNYSLYLKLKKERDDINMNIIKALKPYRIGTYKEWEGDGYFNSPLYLYDGNYYG